MIPATLIQDIEVESFACAHCDYSSTSREDLVDHGLDTFHDWITTRVRTQQVRHDAIAYSITSEGEK
jgi:hypothetical protein